MFLNDGQMTKLVGFRHRLHRRPEVSGEESETARTVIDALAETGAYEIVSGLGGHGVAAIYRGRNEGPTVMIRAELDALPIKEISDIPYRSEIPGKGHLCGHDGHMTTLLALGVGLGEKRPARGRVILLFQPAEENGAGAAAVLADPKFAALKPDFVFALHNFPGLPLGHVALRQGPVNCASRGMKITLSGKTAHASSPEEGVAPTLAIARLLGALTALGSGTAVDENFVRVTVTHCKIGEPAFGISPGHGEIWATLRTLTDERMTALVVTTEDLVRREADASGLKLSIGYSDVFHQCSNSAEAVAALREAVRQEGVSHDEGDRILPMRASEDFGLFRRTAPAAMFFLGAGEGHPGLHNPDYDYPDALIGVGARIFMRTIRNILG